MAPTEMMTVREAHRRLADGSLSAVELLDQVIERIEATEQEAHAYARLDLDAARKAAVAADSRPSQGVLHGMPFGVKDVFEVAGSVTTCGSRALSDHWCSGDAEVVRTLRSAGAVLVGQHVTHELTCGVDEPPTQNPAQPGRYPGGSSAGSAVSVAVGSALFALGTDAAGSVRIPAAINGIVGFKPTHGRLDVRGIVRNATAPSIDHVGILARDVADTASVFGALTDSPREFERPESPRIGVLSLTDEEHLDPAVQALVDRRLSELSAAGADLVPVQIAGLTSAASTVGTIFAAELAQGNVAEITHRADAFHPGVREVIATGLSIDRERLQEAARHRATLRAAFDAVLDRERLAAIIMPTMPVTPPLLSDLDPSTFLPLVTRSTSPFNLIGAPAISLPCGETSTGLPVGLQLAAARGSDWRLLALAGFAEQR